MCKDLINTALFSRVLFSLSGLAKAPSIITAATNAALAGILSFSGIIPANLMPVFCQTVCIDLVTNVIGTWKVSSRIDMQR